MSSGALKWAFENRTAKGPDRMLLVAMADSAGDDGYLSGDGYGSMAHMQAKCNFPSRQTLVEARNWLVEQGLLVMLTPTQRGRGKHNEYVLTMDRDRRSVAEICTAHGWPTGAASPDPSASGEDTNGSATQTDRHSEAVDGTTAAAPAGDTFQPASAPDDAQRGIQAAAPAASAQQASEPVDTGTALPENGSARQTDREVDRSRTGPGPVRPTAHMPLSPTSQLPQLDLLNRTSPECPSTGDVDELDSALRWVRTALAALAPDVAWDISPRQHRQLLEQLAAYPTPDAGATAFVAAAVDASGDLGRWPRAATAWVGRWLALSPPAAGLDEPLCDEHPLGDLPVPKRACATCRTRIVGQQQAAAR